MMEFIRNYAHSWAVKILFGIIVIVFVFFGVNSFNAPRADVVAMVNDTPILAKAYSRSLELAVDNLRRSNPSLDQDTMIRMGLRRDVLMKMVSDLLMVQDATRQGVTVSDEELRQTIMSMSFFLDERGQFDPQRYRGILSRQNQTVREFEDNVRNEMLVQKLTDAVTSAIAMTDTETRDFFLYTRMQAVLDYVPVTIADFVQDVEVTQEEIADWYAQRNETFRTAPRLELTALVFTPDALARNETVSAEQVQAFYAANKDRLFTQEDRVRARHILLRVEQNATPAEAGAVLEQIRGIKARLDNGEDFTALAQELSEDTSNIVGGDLGWFDRGQMVPAFEAVAFSLKPGEISDPVRTDFGYHLIKCEAREEAGVRTFEDVKEEILQRLAREQAASRVADSLDLALERILAGEAFDTVGKDLDVPVQTTPLLTRAEMTARFAMEPEAAEALFLMEAGEVSDAPLPLEDGYLLVRVVNKAPAAIKPLVEVQDDVAARVKAEKALLKAKDAAEALAKELRETPDAHADRVRTTEPFSRSEAIPALGASESLLRAAFDAEPGAWLETPFTLDDGFAVVRVAKRLPPEDAQWDAEKSLWKDHLTQRKQQEMLEAYVQALQQQAKITINNPKFFE
ncbi:MAG: SurA N-terminal domain-containing protein [Desulfovibrio sp.]|nr:SurA N-terminal domain-containing protein [Desulfovibrio sp.]MCA1987049.1 SurA N-terminal domain-containing protein [Desulfovibrio sp.]